MSDKSKDSLGDRMKAYYEDRAKTNLLRKVPVIIRADGRAFHTYCKRFEKPYSYTLNEVLNNVMKYLCENIQGAKYAERHSDEISIFVSDTDSILTDAFFDYSVQKICSIVGSMASTEFCKQLVLSQLDSNSLITDCQHNLNAKAVIDNAFKFIPFNEKWPTFDARCYNMPADEVSNYFYWRMLDAKRNSIQGLAQSKFSHKELCGKNCNELQEMLFQKHGINWNSLPQGQKTGFVCLKKEKVVRNLSNKATYEIKTPVMEYDKDLLIRDVWTVEESPRSIEDLRVTIDRLLASRTNSN